MDTVQLILKNLKDVGIDAKLDQQGVRRLHREHASTASSSRWPTARRRRSSSRTTSSTASTIRASSRTRATSTTRWSPTCWSASGGRPDVAKRREIIHEIQRYLAKQQYYVADCASGVYVAVWDGALKNYGPNLGYDYGGRLMAAWLDR